MNKFAEYNDLSEALSYVLLGKIDLSTKAGDQIYKMLRRAIVEMRLPPGCPISEAEVGAKLGASRTPVREALLRLREEDLVDTLPSRGNFVSTLSEKRVVESQFLRETIELANVKRLAEKGISEKFRQRLELNLTAQKGAAREADYPRFHELDDEFHFLLAHATGLERVVGVLEREKTQLDRLRSLSLKAEGELDRILKEHHAIFDSIVARDVAKATDYMRMHCRTVLDVLEDLSSRHQEYFS